MIAPTASRPVPLRLLACGALLATLLFQPAMAAEPRALGAELTDLRGELGELQGQLQLAQAGGYDMDRLNTFESIVRELTGRVETMEFRVRQLGDRVDRIETRMLDQAPMTGAAEPTRPSATYQPPPESEPDRGGDQVASAPRVLGNVTPSDPQPQAGGSTDQAAPQPQPQPQPQTQPQQQASLPAGDAAAQYDHAFGLLRQANWTEAESELRGFLDRHPNHALAGNAKYWLGETHYVRGDYVSAARVFAEAFQQYPNSGKAPDNLLKLGMSLAALDRRDDACGTLAELERRYSDAPAQIIQRSQAERNRLGC